MTRENLPHLSRIGGPRHVSMEMEVRDGKRKAISSRAFSLFYDCVEDARSHGAKIDLDRVHQEIAAANVNTKLVTESSKSSRM